MNLNCLPFLVIHPDAVVIESVADPLSPSLDADMVTLPGACADTKPVVETVAISAFEVVQVTVCPVRVFPATSFNVAVSCCVAPTMIDEVAGVTTTLAIGTVAALRVQRGHVAPVVLAIAPI
jgi:hypothetical protein